MLLIIGGRNNLKDQKGLNQKASRRQKKPSKEIMPRVKRTISSEGFGRKDILNKRKF